MAGFARLFLYMNNNSDNSKRSLLELLKQQRGVPFHMPGHKRGGVLSGGLSEYARALPYAIDATELPGLDNLRRPNGILREIAEKTAALYGARYAFLIPGGGSTCGILAAVTAALRGSQAEPARGAVFAVSEYCHVSVTNAARLSCAAITKLAPATDAQSGAIGGVLPETVERVLTRGSVPRAVVLTSPTYDGAVSDIAEIAELAHKHGVPLIVDAAHGAHFGLSPLLPQSAVRLGADVEIVSLHKTLPAMTGAAALLVSENSLITAQDIAEWVNVFQTTSPSYPILASIEGCVDFCRHSEAEFTEYVTRVLDLRRRLTENLRVLRLLDYSHIAFGADPGKIAVYTGRAGITGTQLLQILRGKHAIECETADETRALLMTSVCDDPQWYGVLAQALEEIDAGLTETVAAPVQLILPPGSQGREYF